MILVPFKNGWTEKSCRNWLFLVFPQKWSFVVLPKSGRLWCFPKVVGLKAVKHYLPKVVVCGVSPREIKGFSGQPVTTAGFCFGDYGYPMGTLNSQTHFKIGDASL